jgi:hypothetical protein
MASAMASRSSISRATGDGRCSGKGGLPQSASEVSEAKPCSSPDPSDVDTVAHPPDTLAVIVRRVLRVVNGVPRTIGKST